MEENNISDEYRIVLTLPNGGSVKVHTLVSENDSGYQKLLAIAEWFARQGKQVVLTPKVKRPPLFEYATIYGSLIGTKYEGKCPDIAIKNGDDFVFYEFESYTTTNKKRALSNMLHRGFEQSDKLIIDSIEISEAKIKRSIYDRVANGENINELWMLTHNKSCRLIYKKVKGLIAQSFFWSSEW